MNVSARALTVADVAAELGVTVPQVLALIHRAQLTATNVATNPAGKPSWRISREALEEFREARRNRKPVRQVRRRKSTAVREWV